MPALKPLPRPLPPELSPASPPAPPPAPAAGRLSRDGWQKLAICLLLAGLAVAVGLCWEEYLQELELFLYGQEGSLFLALAGLSLWVAVGAMLWRVGLAAAYRPAPPAADAELPGLTVVVPAYNEGRQVLAGLLSLAASDYPADKVQIVAVDDGSTDDTWLWLRRAAARLGGRVELVRLARNQGKRHALYQGFRRARGRVLVTVDSDSEVAPGSLRALVTPLVRDQRVGAVAGNVRVLNRAAGVIPKMMEVAYTFSFEFLRAGQSRVDTVMTTPGALSAYRKSAVDAVAEAWLHQRFLGRPANIGEDRALTNLILRQGLLARFAREAFVFTEVPVGYRPLCRMLLRWARSNVRESLVMAGFVFRRFRAGRALGARAIFLLHAWRMSVVELLKLGGLAYLLAYPAVFGPNLVVAGLLGALAPALVFVWRRHSSNFLWAFPYALFWLAGLSWISLWALATPHRTGWLTRGLGAACPRAPRPAARA
jgi:hyaluronan synthase